jgi:cell fate regulator YaaT (PSP1 superfamily)
MGRGIRFILGNGTNQDVTTVYENIKRNLQELESAEERKEYITKYINKISSEDLSKYNISEADAKDIKNVLKEIYESNNKDLSKFKSKILLEVEKLKDNVDK